MNTNTASSITPTVVAEDEYRWTVKCQGPNCEHLVNTAKRSYNPDGTRREVTLAPRGCIDHPPHTWVQR